MDVKLGLEQTQLKYMTEYTASAKQQYDNALADADKILDQDEKETADEGVQLLLQKYNELDEIKVAILNLIEYL